MADQLEFMQQEKKTFKIYKSVRKILNFEKKFLNWKTFINFKKKRSTI